jgi:hypothetical protein
MFKCYGEVAEDEYDDQGGSHDGSKIDEFILNETITNFS